ASQFFKTRAHTPLWPLRCYSGRNYEPSNNLPCALAVSARFYGGQPTVSDQDFGRIDCALLVSEGVWTVDADIARTDCRFGPPLKKIEQPLCRIFARLADWFWFWLRKQKRFTRHRHFSPLLPALVVRFAC